MDEVAVDAPGVTDEGSDRRNLLLEAIGISTAERVN
ncbi:hypothetical protein Tco_0042629, partial [Tanacetum coccineum]